MSDGLTDNRSQKTPVLTDVQVTKVWAICEDKFFATLIKRPEFQEATVRQVHLLSLDLIKDVISALEQV